MQEGCSNERSRRPSPALVVAMLALFVALSGTALAVNGHRGRRHHKLKLPKNSVGSRQLKRKAVSTGKIANNAINGQKVANGSLSGDDINLSQLGTVPAATEAAHAGNADTVTGHSAACPASTTLIRGVCFDSVANGVVGDLKTASDACAAKGGYLPSPMELFSVRGVINLGTGVGADHMFTDTVYSDSGGGNYYTITVDGTGALTQQSISNQSRYICAYPLIR
jgi:hypothetical protein